MNVIIWPTNPLVMDFKIVVFCVVAAYSFEDNVLDGHTVFIFRLEINTDAAGVSETSFTTYKDKRCRRQQTAPFPPAAR